MAKKKKDRVETSGTDALTHSPFAALLGGAAPEDAEAPREDHAEAIEPGAPFEPKLVVRTEKKGRGGKTVTRVSGVREASRDAIATRLKKALGCGATVEGEDVILLGDVEDRAAAWLEANGARRIARGR